MAEKSVKMVQFDLSLLSKYRTELMGISALMIIICHSNVAGVALPTWLRNLFVLGNVGVDIFLFVSGFGLYYSLTKLKQAGGGIFDWYRKRYKRILIPYLIITVPWWLYFSITRELGFCGFLFNTSTLGYWFLHYGAWYVALLVPLYFVTPLLVDFVDRFPNNRLWVAIVCALALIIFCGVPCDLQNHNFLQLNRNLSLAFERVPIFIIGVGVAPMIKNGNRCNIFMLLLLPILLQVFMKYIPYINNCQRGWLLAFPFMVLFVKGLEMVKTKCVLHRFILFMGTISLESYLANVFVTYALEEFDFQPLGIWAEGNYLFYLLVIIIGMTIAVYANRFSNYLTK